MSKLQFGSCAQFLGVPKVQSSFWSEQRMENKTALIPQSEFFVAHIDEGYTAMRYKFAIKLLVAFSLTACAPLPPITAQTPYNIDEYKQYTQTGPNTIRGQAFLRQKNGGTVNCGGNDVLLMPDSPFFRELLNIASRGRRPAVAQGQIDPALLRKAECNAQGNFTFSNLPNGKWLLATEVSWYAGYKQGGYLVRSIEVSNGAISQPSLSDKDIVRYF